uniref:Secretory peptide n=1 Tax=Heteropoda venatoria TaxID=152925 RepID=A0A088BPR1_HETVE|nr:secretory peptide [Heteropoda venatoria]
MKTTIIITLLIVAFSAVVLAEDSIEQAAMDPVTGRFGCRYSYNECKSDMDCCQNYECYKESFCVSSRKEGRKL